MKYDEQPTRSTGEQSTAREIEGLPFDGTHTDMVRTLRPSGLWPDPVRRPDLRLFESADRGPGLQSLFCSAFLCQCTCAGTRPCPGHLAVRRHDPVQFYL